MKIKIEITEKENSPVEYELDIDQRLIDVNPPDYDKSMFVAKEILTYALDDYFDVTRAKT